MTPAPKKALPFTIPDKGDAEFAALPADVRREVRLWARRLAGVWHLRPITGALRDRCKQWNTSYQTAVRRYYALRKSPDWRSLIDRAKVPLMPLTARVPVPRAGLQVRIVAYGQHSALIQIQRTEGAR